MYSRCWIAAEPLESHSDGLRHTLLLQGPAAVGVIDVVLLVDRTPFLENVEQGVPYTVGLASVPSATARSSPVR